MDKSMVKGLVIGIVIAVAGSVAGYALINKTGSTAPIPEVYADVLDVKDVTETVKTPRQECKEVTMHKQAPVADPNKLTGTIAGAVVGGLLGHEIGGGSGRKVATVAGVAAGGYAGNQIQGNMQKSDVVTTTENRCTTVYDSTQKNVGYDVTYKLNGVQNVVRMSFNPGARIPVKDGQLVLTEPVPAPTSTNK